MGNFTTVPDVVVGQNFPPSLWESAIMNNLNLGVARQLADTTLGASAASIAFSSIPATFAHLLLVLSGRGDTAASNVNAGLRFNNDSGANYATETILATAAATNAVESTSNTSIVAAILAAASATAGHIGNAVILIPNYAGTTFFKQANSFGGETQSITTTGMTAAIRIGVWASTVAINQITLFPLSGNFITGSRATLYGLPS